MRRAKRKPKRSKTPPSSRPHLPLAVHESVAEVEGRTRRLLKGCRNLAPDGRYRLSFNAEKATEIRRTCAADAFDKQAEYLVSLETFRPQWLREAANQTLMATLDLVDPLDLIVKSVPAIEVEVRRTLEASLGEWKHSSPPKQAGESRNGADVFPRISPVLLPAMRGAQSLNH